MSPTKSDAASPPAKENAKAGESKGAPPSSVEFEPPLACVRRILKHSLPSSTNVGKDASAAFARASGIFIIYVTACANDFARENRRQTITANDVLAAIKELEFDEFTPELTTFLERYRKNEKTKKENKAKIAAAKSAAGGDDDEEEEEEQKVATPQSVKSRDTDGADPSMEMDDGDDQTDCDEDREAEDDIGQHDDGDIADEGEDVADEGEDDEDLEDMEE